MAFIGSDELRSSQLAVRQADMSSESGEASSQDTVTSKVAFTVIGLFLIYQSIFSEDFFEDRTVSRLSSNEFEEVRHFETMVANISIRIVFIVLGSSLLARLCVTPRETQFEDSLPAIGCRSDSLSVDKSSDEKFVELEVVKMSRAAKTFLVVIELLGILLVSSTYLDMQSAAILANLNQADSLKLLFGMAMIVFGLPGILPEPDFENRINN